MRRAILLAVCLGAIVGGTNQEALAQPGARPAAAPQTPAAAQRPAASTTPALSIRGGVDAGLLAFAAREPFDAVYDGRSGFAWGGFARVAHRWGWFAQVSAQRWRAEGERVFIAGGQVFPLGIESELTVVPLDFTGGWRFLASRRRPRGQGPAARAGRPARPQRLVPYVGGGVGVVRVSERADFAQGGDNVRASHASYHVLGGVELPLSRWLGAGFEVGYRWVPGGLEGNGVAAEYDERDLHHLRAGVQITVGR